MSVVLDLIYLGLLVVVSPILVLKSWRTGKYRDGWGEKVMGRAPRRVGTRPCLWFHAVSVGEVLLLRPLVAELQRRRPSWDIVVSTTTESGLAVARRTFPDLITFYAPLDFSWATRRAMSRIRPTVLALVELEVWPNLIAAAKRAGARVAVVNGRLSERSFRGYARIRPLIARTLERIDVIAAQGEETADRFLRLGVPAKRVRVTGSVKYDGLETERDNAKTLQLRRELGLHPADVVFVAGSTMEGEEAAAARAYQAAVREHPRLRLVVVPRHIERAEKVAGWLESQGLEVARRSHGPIGRPARAGENSAVILVDTVGELGAVWGLADVAFVGGSLFPGRNGQNMMEPAAYGAAVLFGTHTSNFREAVEGLLSRGGARRVQDAKALEQALCEDLDDPEAAARRGAAGRTFVMAQNGAAARTLWELDALFFETAAPRRSALILK